MQKNDVYMILVKTAAFYGAVPSAIPRATTGDRSGVPWQLLGAGGAGIAGLWGVGRGMAEYRRGAELISRAEELMKSPPKRGFFGRLFRRSPEKQITRMVEQAMKHRQWGGKFMRFAIPALAVGTGLAYWGISELMS